MNFLNAYVIMNLIFFGLTIFSVGRGIKDVRCQNHDNMNYVIINNNIS